MAAAYNNRGFAYYGKKDYDRAIADCEAALRIEPNYPDAGTGLKYARQARGYEGGPVWGVGNIMAAGKTAEVAR
jgi:tetratricopeptide (TPR) repeat protein